MGGWVNTSGPNPNTRTREDVEKIVTVLLGGRAADVILGNGANTGALTDIAEANDLLRHAMTEACIYDSLTTLSSIDPWRWNGTTLSEAIDSKLRKLSADAQNIIKKRKTTIEELAERLTYERIINTHQ
jgi:cell division protease FtsH